jgi:type 1 glutamine amidotransferase
MLMLPRMNSWAPSLFLILIGLGAAAGLAAAPAGPPLRVLYFTKSSGYEHSVVKREGGKPSYSERVLSALAATHRLELTFSKDGSLFSPDYLARFDVFVFYTSGDLFAVGDDGQPPLTPAGKQALLDAIAGGKGFVGLHSAGDTFHTFETGGGNPADRSHRYTNHGAASDPYILMLGGEFINHGAQQVAKARVVDPAFPGCGGMGPVLEVKEEWYSQKEFASNLHVLLVMETEGMEGVDYQRPPYPLAWARTFGRGRVWYNAMGHREDIWDNPAFQAMLIGGIEWAGGRLQAEATPNLPSAAPGAGTLPPYRPGT